MQRQFPLRQNISTTSNEFLPIQQFSKAGSLNEK